MNKKENNNASFFSEYAYECIKRCHDLAIKYIKMHQYFILNAQNAIGGLFSFFSYLSKNPTNMGIAHVIMNQRREKTRQRTFVGIWYRAKKQDTNFWVFGCAVPANGWPCRQGDGNNQRMKPLIIQNKWPRSHKAAGVEREGSTHLIISDPLSDPSS